MDPNPLPAAILAELDRIGPVDLVVGVAPATTGATPPSDVTGALRTGLEAHLGGRAALLVQVDRTASDAPDADTATSGGDLRVLRVPSSYSPPDGDGALRWSGAAHAVLQAGRRLGAAAIVLLDGDAGGPATEWVWALAEPVLKESYGLVLPVHQRYRYDGTLTQCLVIPYVRALFGRQLAHPLADEFACSGDAARALLDKGLWQTDLGQQSLDLALPVVAIDGELAIGQAGLGPRTLAMPARPAPLGRTVGRVASALFELAERYETAWLDERGSGPVATFGVPREPLPGGPPVDPERLQVGFRQGVRDLLPVWERILAPDTLGDVLALDTFDAPAFRFGDRLWAHVVYDFLLAARARVMYPSHLAQSLAPLYLGRVASLVIETQGRALGAVAEAGERLGRVFEDEKPYLVDRWR